MVVNNGFMMFIYNILDIDIALRDDIILDLYLVFYLFLKVIFTIGFAVCEEVVWGIPKQAFWVGFLSLLVFFVAFYTSYKLPATLVPANSRGSKDFNS